MKIKSQEWFDLEMLRLKEEYFDDVEHEDLTDIFLKKTLIPETNKLKREVQEEYLKKGTLTTGILIKIDRYFHKMKQQQREYMRESGKEYSAKHQHILSVGFGNVGTYTKMDTKKLEDFINASFKDSTFSERLNKNVEKTKKILQEEIIKGVKKGQSDKKTARIISEKLDIAKYRASTLVRTELARVYTEIELEDYKQIGVTEIEFMATLDSRTSHICREHDGDVFAVTQAVVGENVPPLHPNCRSTTVPYTGYAFEERMGRNLKTGKSEYMPSNIKNYKDYEKEYIEWL